MARSNSAQKILQCATKMFARHGFDGTIMDELASVCEVNKATIYYHYKDKANLYEEVLVRHLERVVSAVIEAIDKENTAKAKIEAYIAAFSAVNSQNSYVISILMREIASGSESMPDRAKSQMHRMLLTLKAILSQGVKEEGFESVDPLMIHFMVLGSLSFFIASEPMRKAMVSNDPELLESFQNATLEEVTQKLSTMILKALIKKES